MRSVEYMGYLVCQYHNNHVSIYKDGRMVMHSQCDKRKTDKELRAMVHHFLKLTAAMDAAGYPERTKGMV